MSRLFTKPETQLSQEVLTALEPVRQKGKIADVYLQFANSEPAILAYLGMEQGVRQGSLSPAEVEAIKLRISQITGCEFCLAVHTMKASAVGLTSDQQLAIRRGDSLGLTRIDALLTLADHLFHSPGALPGHLLDEAQKAGIDDATLVDLTLTMATIFFTNITNHINDTKTSLPPAPSV
ncbi:MAG: carboxymuconolactone decarboxylase family protein [Gammaproteobacteria bacterium]|nr:carboxymuconolactone decarboxylase family protein [Gammaproteobacteria bacterium]